MDGAVVAAVMGARIAEGRRPLARLDMLRDGS
jgi:hypothetical protein